MNIRISSGDDAPHMRRWLLEPGLLRFFPMCDGREVDDSIRIWLSYIPQKASLTVEVDGKIAGMGVLYISPFQKLKHQCLFAIIVAPEFRGQGVGTALLTEMEKQAKENFGIELLHLEVYETNPAYKLYKRQGFVEYGQQAGFMKEGPDQYGAKILMQKSL